MLEHAARAGRRRPTFNDRPTRGALAAAARLSGPERYLTYGKLDLDLARNACTAGRVRQPPHPRLLLHPDRLPNLRGLRHGPRGAMHQAQPTIATTPTGVRTVTSVPRRFGELLHAPPKKRSR